MKKFFILNIFCFLLLSSFALAQPSLEKFQISYQVSPCLGICPAFQISVDEEGKLVWKGEKFVKDIGEKITQIPKEKALFLFNILKKAHYENWKDEYDAEKNGVYEGSRSSLTITVHQKTKTIHWIFTAPKKLLFVVTQLLELADAKRHIGTLP